MDKWLVVYKVIILRYNQAYIKEPYELKNLLKAYSRKTFKQYDGIMNSSWG